MTTPRPLRQLPRRRRFLETLALILGRQPQRPGRPRFVKPGIETLDRRELMAADLGAPEEALAAALVDASGSPTATPGAAVAEGEAADAIDPSTPGAAELYALDAEQSSLFSAKYLAMRQRYLEEFFFNGMSAGARFVDASGKTHIEFFDQTVHMGFALLAFAGESRVLDEAGLDNSASEQLISRLLDGFEELERGAAELYGHASPGFFLRDYVTQTERQGVPDDAVIKSDANTVETGGDPFIPAMSGDQTLHMMMGWWGVSRWSSDAANVERAQAQATRVITYLMDKGFLNTLPDGSPIPVSRGGDLRPSAGFITLMASQVTGHDYYHEATIRVDGGDLIGGLTLVGAAGRLDLGAMAIGGVLLANLDQPLNLPVSVLHEAARRTSGAQRDGLVLDELHIPLVQINPELARLHQVPATMLPLLEREQGTATIDLANSEIIIRATESRPGFERNLLLMQAAFDPEYSQSDYVAIAAASNHPFGVALRSQVLGTPLPTEVQADLLKNHLQATEAGPGATEAAPWAKPNRWERCNDPLPSAEELANQARYNGLDFLAMENLMRVGGIGAPQQAAPGDTVTATLVGDTLVVSGTLGDDQVTVREHDGRVSVDGVDISRGELLLHDVAVESLGRIEIWGWDGEDVLRADGAGAEPVRTPVRMYGGDGDDVLFGGELADSLFGELGDDELHGGDGDDALYGGVGVNSLWGESGADQLADGAEHRAVLRPTLIVVTHGAQTDRALESDVWFWGGQFSAALQAKGAHTETWLVDWESMSGNDAPTAELARRIDTFLREAEQDWDLLFVGHSRGGIFQNQVVARLTETAHRGAVYQVSLDPTASPIMQDEFPRALPPGTLASQYDDGYQFLTTTIDGVPIDGATHFNLHHELREVQTEQYEPLEKSLQAWEGILQTAGFEVPSEALLRIVSRLVRAGADALAQHSRIPGHYFSSHYFTDDVERLVRLKTSADVWTTGDETPGATVTQVLPAEPHRIRRGDALQVVLHAIRFESDRLFSQTEYAVEDAHELARVMLDFADHVASLLGNETLARFVTGTRTALDWLLDDQLAKLSLFRLGNNEKFLVAWDQVLGVSDPTLDLLEDLVLTGLEDGRDQLVAATRRLLAPLAEAIPSSPQALLDRVFGVLWNDLRKGAGEVARTLISEFGASVPDVARLLVERALPTLSGAALADQVWQCGWDLRIAVLRQLSMARVSGLVGSLSPAQLTELAQQTITPLGVAWVGEALGTLPWDKFLGTLRSLNIGQVGSVLDAYSSSRVAEIVGQEISRHGAEWIADALAEIPHINKLVESLGQLSKGRVGAVLDNYSARRIADIVGAAYSRLGVDWVGDALWALSGTNKLVDTLDRLSIGRVGAILDTYSAGRIGDIADKAYSRLGAGWVADALWAMPGMNKLVDALDHLSMSRVGAILNKYSVGRLDDIANTAYSRLGASWVGSALWAMPGINKLVDTLNRLSMGRVGRILGTYSSSRIAEVANSAFTRLGANWVSRAVWELSWDKRIGALDRLSVGRAAAVVWQYDWGRIYSTLGHMSSGRAWDLIRQFPISYASKLAVRRRI